MPANWQLQQKVAAHHAGRKLNWQTAVLHIAEVHAGHVEGVDACVELPGLARRKIELVALAAQKRARLFRIMAVKDPVTPKQRCIAKLHAYLRVRRVYHVA